MKRVRIALRVTILLAAGALLAACRGPATVTEEPTPQFAVQRSLVIMPAIETEAGAVDASDAWERHRNDDAQGIGRQSGLFDVREFVTYSRDRLRTDSGRPRENSRTVTREIRRGTLFVR